MRSVFIFFLVFSLLAVAPYQIGVGVKKNEGWEKVAVFFLRTSGRLFLQADGEALIISAAGEVVPFSRSLKINPDRVAPGRYFLLLKEPGKWKLLFLPEEVKKEEVTVLSPEECERWLRREDLLGRGKVVTEELEKIGVVTLFQADDKIHVYKGKDLPWLSWWEDEKLKGVPEFRPTYDPYSVHFIYRLPLIMYHQNLREKGIFCLSELEDLKIPFLPGIYRYLGWSRINIKLFNSVGIRLYHYLKMRIRGIQKEDAFLRADAIAKLEYSEAEIIPDGMQEIFEKIYRRYFQ